MTEIEVGLLGYRQFREVRQAREHYDFVTREEVVDASETLLEIEAESIWISHHTAQKRHFKRLSEFVRAVEGSHIVTMYGSEEGHASTERFIEETRRFLQRHGMEP